MRQRKKNKFLKRFSLNNAGEKITVEVLDQNEGIQEEDQFGPYDHQLAIMGEPYSGESPPLFHQFDTQVSRRLLFIRIKFRNRFLMGCFPSKIEIESRILPDFWPFSYH